MQCPSCSHDNATDARFCSHCGTALERRCPSCSSTYEPDDRFCSHCGTALADAADPGAETDPSAELSRYVPSELLRKIRASEAEGGMRGERRTVTMLFADIQGSTAAAQHLDPEDWAEIMNGAFEHLIAPVYRFEGTLARLQGDAILAFFGAPIAHEDDPVRAVRAGLAMQTEIEGHRDAVERRFGITIGLRVGINTGLVVVGEVGSDLRVEYTALGDAINVAARMEQTATPGTVRITADTLALLGDQFVTEPIGTVDVKGRTEPVVAHRVIDVHDGVDLQHQRIGAVGQLVGRAEELEQLRQVVASVRSGTGGIALLVGEAGLGKSRLLRAVEDDLAGTAVTRAAGAPGEVAWLDGRATAYEQSVPHALVADVLARWWGRDEGAFDRIVTSLLQPTSTGTVPADVAADTAGFLTAIVGGRLPAAQAHLLESLETPALHRRTTTAVAEALTVEAARRPVVVVLDDLHWADSTSLALVEHLMGVTEHAALALLLVMRPAQEEPAWRLREAALQQHGERTVVVDLQPLAEDDTAALLGTLLEDVEVDDDARAAILHRAEGNPLFVEEIVRALDDRDPAAGGRQRLHPRIAVPPSLAGLLTARLDQLDDDARHLAQVASVIGREFSVTTLAAAAGHEAGIEVTLDQLLRRGILEPRGTPMEPTYWFRHPLLHETAYSTMLRRTRRELHGRIAEHLGEHMPDQARQIATHWLEADQPSRAFAYLVEAGRVALRAMALGDAFAAFEAAVDVADDDADPELVLAAHQGLGEAHSLVPDLPAASAAYQSLLEAGRRSGNTSMQIAALNSLGFSTAALAGRYDDALGYLDQARLLAQQTGDEMGLAEYHMNACFVVSLAGLPDQAVEHDAATVRIGEQAGNELVRLTGLVRGAANLLAAGRYDDAGPAYQEALEALSGLEQEETVAALECMVHAPLLLRDGRVPAAIDVLREHLATLDRYVSFYGGAAHHWLGRAVSLRGRVEDALTAYAAAERLGRETSQPFAVAAGIAARAQVLAEAGLVTELDDLRDEATATLAERGADFYSTSAWADLGYMELARDDVDAATRQFEEALASSSTTRAWEVPRIRFGLVRALLRTDEPGLARTQLELAREYVTSRRLRLREPELFLLDGATKLREGDIDDARTLVSTAVDAASETGARVTRVEALRLLADLRRRAGEAAEADALTGRADETVAGIVRRIADPALAASVRARLQSVSLTQP